MYYFLDDVASTNYSLKYRNLRLLVICFRLPHMLQSSIFSDFLHGGPEPPTRKHAFSQFLAGFRGLQSPIDTVVCDPPFVENTAEIYVSFGSQ